MSFDKTTQEYHLTPNGWVTGTYSAAQTEVVPPVDRVETWEHNMEQSSPFSREIYSWARIWVSPNINEKDLADLHRKFPRPKD